MENFFKRILVFGGLTAPEEATLVGYCAIISKLQLEIPLPATIALISDKQTAYQKNEWFVFSSKMIFDDRLYKHLVFALKYEGINLLFFKSLFQQIGNEGILLILKEEPLGQYSRRLWFLYEWLQNTKLDIPDLTIKNYEPLLDEKLQYALPEGVKMKRYRIINNLPGTRDFCPLIRKTPKLEQHIASKLMLKNERNLQNIHRDILLRTSAFLLLKDSKASFTIEGESPKSKRASRWANAIGQAGTVDLSKAELVRLQQVVIENERFIDMGFRQKGGFIGEHDRITGEPIPSHISARWQDVEQLIDGLLSTYKLQINSGLDAVLSAAIIAFGFVFIHPFEDGNGRIHRYLIHHVLAKMQFSQQGLVFPVSASILSHIVDYRKVLESYSLPLLDFIKWDESKNHNVEVLNETMDYYRYFDATKQAEFLYDCVYDTIENIIPQEIDYLIKYDAFKRFLDDEYEMPDSTVALLIKFLEQNRGKLSLRAREKEFAALTAIEIQTIEHNFALYFD